MNNRAEQDARHREAVGIYYATDDEAVLGPMLAEVRDQGLRYLRGSLGMGNAEQAEDIAQQALTELLRYLRERRFQVDNTPGALLCGICRSRFRDYQTRERRKPSEPGQGEDPYQFLPASTATPAQELPAAEVQQAAATVLTAAT